MADRETHPARLREVVIGTELAGVRLDRALAVALPDLSRSRLKALIEGGTVRMGSQVVRDPAAKTKSGEVVTVVVPSPAAAAPAAQALPLDIVFEDEHLIVVDKPAGLVVHPAAGNPDRTLVNALLAHCGPSLAGIGGVARPGIVHRLDKDTSGLLVIAKTEAAHAGLAAQFAAHSIERAYQALVRGLPRPAAGTITGAIGRSPKNRKKMAVLARGGRPATTHYRTLRRFGPNDRPLAALVECTLETGRTHQIRVHLAHSGHAVLGDPLYGRGAFKDHELTEAVKNLGRQALHAVRLGFRHPENGEVLRFSSKLPADFVTLFSFLERC